VSHFGVTDLFTVDPLMLMYFRRRKSVAPQKIKGIINLLIK
jgi:hypothetical protein